LEFGSAMGLKYFEIDVKLTKDLIPIVFHDEHMYRLTGINEFVKNLTLSQIKEIKYRDGQSILTIDELVTHYQNILIDLSANNFQDAIYITEYILNINNTSLQDMVIIQFADPKIIELVSKKYPKLKISYNEWGDRIKKTKIYKNYANIFTLNPSSHINQNIIAEIGSDKVIIAVVQGDDAGEIIRLKGIGIKNIMIRNSLLINREFYRNKSN
jgi:glycerophosphoryl diester phosphodiesterase